MNDHLTIDRDKNLSVVNLSRIFDAAFHKIYPTRRR